MTTSFDTAPALTSAATFNAYYSALRSAILAMGWVQMPDTGQVDLSTNAVLPPAQAFGLFQLFRMNDALQATSPVVLRIGMGQSGYAMTSLQIGRVTDGVGEFVGDSTPILTVYTNNAGSSSVVHTSYASGASNRLWVAMNASLKGTGTPNSHITFFSIERSKDVTGTDTGDFVTLVASGAADAAPRQTSLHSTYGATLAENRWVAPFPFNSTSLSFGVGGGALPVFPFLGRLENPLMDVGLGKATDFTHAANVTVNSYGLNRPYKVLKAASGNTQFAASLIPQVSASAGPAVLARWE